MRIAIFLCVFLVASCAALWAAALAFEAAQTTRTNYKYISSALAPIPQRDLAVTWRSPDTEMVRPFTPADAVLIGRALQEAWQIHAVAQDSGNPDLIADRFTGVAQERATLSVKDALAHGGRMIVLSQEVTPRFYHKDGSLFQAQVEMMVVRYLSADGINLDTIRVTQDTGIATLLNESNGWRLMSWERRTSVPFEQSVAGFEGQLFGMNYYPAETPWRDFWPSFDAGEIARDFAKIKDLNANSVRVFLTRDAFIGDQSEAALANLTSLLAAADAQSLRVVPTLFDLKQDFGLGTWADDAEYLKRVLPVLAQSPAVAFVDLKNEPDLDFDAHGRAKVTAWLSGMLTVSRSVASDLAFSIGWSAAQAADILVDELDVISYHDYAPIESAEMRLADVRAKIGDKPIYITEIGTSTFTLAAGFPGSETAQAKRLEQRLSALSNANGVMVWTLYDFPNVDPTVVGGSPWVKRLQAKFGVFRADRSEKPAANVLRAQFSAEK